MSDWLITLDRAAIDALPLNICIVDGWGTILAVNAAWRRFAAENPPLLANVCEGANYLAVCDAAADDPLASTVGKALREIIAGRLHQLKLDYPCHSPSEERWFTVRARPCCDHDGVRVVIAHECVTERVLAERALRRSEEQYRRMIEHALDGVVVADHNRIVRLVNDAASGMTGYSREEMLGMQVDRFVAAEQHPRLVDVWRALLQGRTDESEWRLLRKDGSHTIAEVRSRMQSDGRVVIFARDVTARKEAEALTQARDAAEAANRAKDQFLAVLSHELRTPLTPVLTAAQLTAEDARLPAETREAAAMIRRNIQLQAQLIDDLLDQTRIARGKLQLRPTRFRSDEAAQQVVDMLLSDYLSRRIELRVESRLENPEIEADRVRVQQILWNLLSNALKFTPVGGIVTVRLTNPHPNCVRFEVIDTGIGIKPDFLSRLFRPYEQCGSDVTRRYGGLGLGLAISEQLARMQHGSLSVRSEGLDRGATFTLELPAAPPLPPAPRGAVGKTARRVSARRLHILLVEDHPDTARILARLLERRGHHVHVCNTLRDAEKTAEAESFDLLLSDITLPDGTGYELMEFMRHHHPAPAVAMTGLGMDEDIRRSHEAGFIEHLTKPVDPTRLEEVVWRFASAESR